VILLRGSPLVSRASSEHSSHRSSHDSHAGTRITVGLAEKTTMAVTGSIHENQPDARFEMLEKRSGLPSMRMADKARQFAVTCTYQQGALTT
jgi:hypothetical protein